MNPAGVSQISQWSAAGTRVAAAIIVETEGSTPHGVGLAMLVSENGEIAGAVSGGCVDGDIVHACDDVLRTGLPQALAFGGDDGEFGAPGLFCGGSLRVWICELAATTLGALAATAQAPVAVRFSGLPHAGPDSQQVFTGEAIPADAAAGKTHVSREANGGLVLTQHFGVCDLLLIVGRSGFSDALCQIGSLLGFEVVVCEPRPRFAGAIGNADRVEAAWPDACIERLHTEGRLNDRSIILVCTHDRKFDEPALTAAVRTPAGFIGAMGSRLTTEERWTRLRALGLTEDDLARIHSPVGLDLGADTQMETAISVFAECIATRSGRSRLPLREITGPIHASYAG